MFHDLLSLFTQPSIGDIWFFWWNILLKISLNLENDLLMILIWKKMNGNRGSKHFITYQQNLLVYTIYVWFESRNKSKWLFKILANGGSSFNWFEKTV
jgi:hypothetical protein